MAEVTNMMHLLTFDGHASSFANYEEKGILRDQISTLDPEKRAADLPLRMPDIARKVRMSVGEDSVGSVGGAGLILRKVRERFAPDAIDGSFQDMLKFTYSERTDQNMDR